MAKEQVRPRTQNLEGPEFQVEVISDAARFNSIADEWDRLVQCADVDRLFLSHTWLRTWWELFGQGRRLHVITVRAAGELVAAAPMMRSPTRRAGLTLDTVESMYSTDTPRYDFIVSREWSGTGVYQAIWRQLSQDSDSDLIVLTQVPETSSTLPAIEELAAADGWLTGRWSSRPSPYIQLGCEYTTFFNQLRGGHRYNLRKRYERLSKLGAIDVEVITEKSGLRAAMQDGLRIEAAAWKGREGTAISSDPSVSEFYMRLAEREADLGQLRLSFLRVGGKRISFSYILRSQKTLYGVKIGYDPEYHMYSPGNMLLNLVLQQACAEGMAEYDFLGANDEWKFDWTQDVRCHHWLFLFRNSLRSKFLHYIKFSVVPMMKQHAGLVQLRNGILGLRRAVEHTCISRPGRA